MKKYRITYDPELHEMHCQRWSDEDLMYLCSMYETMQGADLALALGRTHATIIMKVHNLRKVGLFASYKQRGKEM